MTNRIMIIGQPGSGKSTLARAMGEITHLSVVHIDNIHWQPGWIERPQSEKERLCSEVHAQEQWIFEGGHFNLERTPGASRRANLVGFPALAKVTTGHP